MRIRFRTVIQAIFERLQRDIEVSVGRREIRAGEFVTVRWSGNTLTELVPAWLVVATDAPVRFPGEGFYALMPNAIGPFGIKTFKQQTRAIVPLYGRGARQGGVIEVSELYRGVKRQVVERTEGRQTPWLARNQMVGDFALF